MKVLNIIPDQAGGIESYYEKLRLHFTLPVVYFITGRRPQETFIWGRIIRLAKDYWRFWRKLRLDRHDLVVVNPSLEFKGVVRDGIFVLLASWAGVAGIVFFHGWRQPMEELIDRRLLRLFLKVFGRTSAAIVLAAAFKSKLISWGYQKKIYTEVTLIDDAWLSHDVASYVERRLREKHWRILFVGKIYREKGIYEAVDAVALLCQRYTDVELLIAGDGPELPELKDYSHRKAPGNVTFHGYTVGHQKHMLFQEAHCLLLPSYTEGMPSVVIEAMAAGLPVVTRLVGGLRDFFVNGLHGFATDSFDPCVFADFLELLLLNRELYRKISLFNQSYARSHFSASQAAARLEDIYRAAVSSG